MNAPELEKCLAALTPRRLPGAWKAGVLEGVAAARRPTGFHRAERLAWGAVAATWLAIFALRATTPFIPTPPGPPASAAEIAAHCDEIRRYAALEFASPESPPPTRIRIEEEFILVRPRS
ncbi:MAG: hypothetical protein PHC88_05320 [Terrimicrobiaceae bacterium]|nr:hypothetical protein [Terrimicrobiaceae bacterium]